MIFAPLLIFVLENYNTNDFGCKREIFGEFSIYFQIISENFRKHQKNTDYNYLFGTEGNWDTILM
jgi:hypothetical protein